MNDLRISYIDQLKGIAILLVVLGHVIGYNNCEDSFFGVLFIHSTCLFLCSLVGMSLR